MNRDASRRVCGAYAKSSNERHLAIAEAAREQEILGRKKLHEGLVWSQSEQSFFLASTF